MTNTNKTIHETLYYMTQYANYMSDADYYESMYHNFKTLDNDKLSYLCNDLAPYVNDKYNEILFDLLYRVNNDKQLDRLIKIWECFKDDDFETLCELLDIDFYDWDDTPYSPEDLESLADDDLRTNGVNARCLYWLEEIDFDYSVHVFNVYMNGFHYFSNINEYLNEYLEQYVNLDEAITKYINLD